MRVLMITREFPPIIVGGIAKHTFYLTKYLKRKGVKVKVVSFGDSRLSSEDIMFIEPRSSITSRELRSVAEDAKILLDIARFTNTIKAILRSEDFDVIHVQEPYVGGLVSYEYKVTTIHDTSFGEIKSYLKYLDGGSFKRIVFYVFVGYFMEFSSIMTSKVIISPSPDVVWEMIRVYRTPKDKVRFIPNGVEEPLSNEPDKLNSRRVLKLPEDYFIIFTTAQHVARKRLETLVKAAKVLKEKGFKNFIVMIGGVGPFTGYLRRLTVNIGVHDVVRFIGWISDDELPLYYRAADVFVITSEYEAGPLTMLEAGIRGVPLIVSDVLSGFMMIARDGLDCLKFKLGDALDLAEKITMISSDYDLWKSLSRGARAFASLFKWDNIADKTIAVYKEVLSS
jgi:1,4-alpha-glucan branching enzyme